MGAVRESQFESEFEHGQHQYRFYAVPRYSQVNAYGYVRPIGR